MSSSDPSFDAFLYVANELDAAEREQFEQRLRDDQAAREAVAEAVELTQTLVYLRPELSGVAPCPAPRAGASHRPASNSRRRQRTAWLAWAGWTLAAAMLVAWIGSGRKDGSQSMESIASVESLPVVDASLAEAWTQLRGSVELDWERDADLETDDDVLRDAGLPGIAVEEGEANGDELATNWIGVAVEGMERSNSNLWEGL